MVFVLQTSVVMDLILGCLMKTQGKWQVLALNVNSVPLIKEEMDVS